MSTIRIKRSTVAGNPAVLAAGELAYSGLTNNGANGGDRLYIGLGTETGGNAANHFVVGGKYFTDLMAGTAGTLVTNANSVPILNSAGVIDKWYVGNLFLNGNSIATTNTNGTLTLSPNGSGLVSIAGAYTLPRVDGTNGYVLTTNGAGAVTWQQASSNLSIAGTSGTGSVALTSQSLTIAGSNGISATAANQTITVSFNTSTLVTTAVNQAGGYVNATTGQFSGVTTVTNTTPSSSTATGALQVAGGVGVGGNLYVGGEIVASKLTIQYTTVTTTLVETDDIIRTSNNTEASSTNSGALQVSGGAGFGGNIHAGGTIYSAGIALQNFNTSTLVALAVSAQSATTATSAATAYALAGGVAGSFPYQTSAGATGFLAIGSGGQVLQVSTITGLAIWADIDGGVY